MKIHYQTFKNPATHEPVRLFENGFQYNTWKGKDNICL